MSRTGSIHIHFKSKLSVRYVDDLIANDWSYNDFGHISYFADEDYSWTGAALDEWGAVRRIIEENINAGKLCGLSIISKTFNTGGQLVFLSGTHLMFVISINVRWVDDGYSFDYEFYHERLLAGWVDQVSSLKFGE